MGETTCLMQPFSYTSGISNQAKEGTAFQELGQSVSFGRFMSEPLAWDRWSSFSSQNKYAEEAEKYSRPGSVAQMKAFFEAHYRNLAARKAAEAANAAAAEAAAAAAGNSNSCLQPENVEGRVANDNASQAGLEEVSQVTVVTSDENGYSQPLVEIGAKQKLKMGDLEEVDLYGQSSSMVDDCVEVESLSHYVMDEEKEEVAELELSGSKQMEKPLLKDFVSDRDEEMVSTSKIRSATATPKPLSTSRSKKVQSSPVKPSAKLRTRKDSCATPISRRSAIECSDRRKQTPKSTCKSMNSTPVKEFHRITASIIRKIDSSRAGSTAKSSQSFSTPLKTITEVPKQADAKQTFATPQTENRSSKASTPLHPSASGSKTTRARWNFLPTDCSKFMTAGRNKPQSPFAPSPFSLRTEERAARRKEKLDEKFNADHMKKLQLQPTLKEKAGSELKKLRQSLCFKARPLPDFYKERAATKDQMEKVPWAHPPSPSHRKPAPRTPQKATQPSMKSSNKSSGFKHAMVKHDKASRNASRAAGENTSPNVPSFTSSIRLQKGKQMRNAGDIYGGSDLEIVTRLS